MHTTVHASSSLIASYTSLQHTCHLRGSVNSALCHYTHFIQADDLPFTACTCPPSPKCCCSVHGRGSAPPKRVGTSSRSTRSRSAARNFSRSDLRNRRTRSQSREGRKDLKVPTRLQIELGTLQMRTVSIPSGIGYSLRGEFNAVGSHVG